MRPTDRQSLLEAYKKILSYNTLLKENEEPLKEEDLDNTEESLVQDIKEFLEDAFRVETFEEAGVMTNNKGLVVTTASGKQFQVQVLRSK